MTLAELCALASELNLEVRQVHAMRPATVAIIGEEYDPSDTAILNTRTGLPLFSAEEAQAHLEKLHRELQQRIAERKAAREMRRKQRETARQV